jgi:hypothetical protein
VTPADLELINRYLAGDASAEEVYTIEGRIVGDPAFRKEVELTEALRGGIRELHRMGELPASLSHDPPFWQRPSYALAASIVAGLLAILSYALFDQLNQARQSIASLSRQLTDSAPSATSRIQVLRIAQTRGERTDPDAVWEQSQGAAVLELHLDVGLAAAPEYSLSLHRLTGKTQVLVLEVPHLVPSEDGEIVASLHSSLLSPGDYGLTLMPTPAGGGETAALTFRMRVMN